MRPSSVSPVSLCMLIAVNGACSRSPRGAERVSLDKVPAAAKAAADKATPGVRWVKAERTREHGKMVYALKARDPKGKKVKVEVFPDGERVTLDAELCAATTAVGIPSRGTD
jgi:hypothetical protein